MECSARGARTRERVRVVSGSRLLAFIVTSALLSCVPDRPVHDAVDALIAGVPCSSGVRALLDAWGGGSRFLTGPSSRGGPVAYRVPAGPIGSWLVVDPGGDGSVLVARWDDRFAEARLFQAVECAAIDPESGETVRAGGRRVESGTTSVTGGPMGPAGSPVFTDADLREELLAIGSPFGGVLEESAAGRRERASVAAVVVYTWSPHMPLSVDGYREIERAAETLGLEVVPVLIAGGNRDFARREAERVGIPESGVREVGSVELWMRDAQVHAPSILVFGADRVSPVLPGYRNESSYGAYLEAFLNAR